jgi:hypothetical protein
MKAKRIRWAGSVALLLENMYAYKILVRKPEGKDPRTKFRGLGRY